MAFLIPDIATGISVPRASSTVWPYWAKPWPSSRVAEILKDCPDTAKLAANAPCAIQNSMPPATTAGTPAATAKRRQSVRP